MMIKQTQAIIFDFDGTLVDSMGLWHEIDVAYLGKRGLACPEDMPYEISGKSFTETAEYFKKRFQLPDTIDTIKAEWSTMSEGAILTKIGFKPGALSFLSWAFLRDIPMSIATSNTRSTLELFLNHYDIAHYFQSLHFTCEVGLGKPNPDVFFAAAKSLGVSPESCLVFEDTLEGIQGALSAGMTVISVDDSYQYHRQEDIQNSSFRHIKNFQELMTEDFYDCFFKED